MENVARSWSSFPFFLEDPTRNWLCSHSVALGLWSLLYPMECPVGLHLIFYVLFATSKSYLRFYVLFFPAQSIWNFRWLWYISLKWYFSITKINKWNVAWELEGDMKWVETAEMIVLKESILLKEPNLIQFHQNSVKRVWIPHSLAWS